MAQCIWTIVAALFALAAGLLLWRNNMPAAFVTATLGAVAWFLSYRAQLRAKIDAEKDSNELEADEQTDEK
jgi:hypothetical protein